MCYSSPFHLESLERPVTRRHGPNESRRDVIALKLKGVIGVELARPGGFLEHFIDGGFQILVELLKQILKQESKQLSCPL